MGFFDLSDGFASLDAKKKPLVEIDAVVPWDEFRPVLERAWRKTERKSQAAVMMFKAVVPGARYKLSNDQIEYQLRGCVIEAAIHSTCRAENSTDDGIACKQTFAADLTFPSKFYFFDFKDASSRSSAAIFSF